MRCIWFSSCLGGKLKKMELLDWNLSPCHLFPAVSCVCVCAFGNYQERYRGRSGVLGWVYGGVSGLTGFVCLFRWGRLGSDGGEMAILNGKYIRNDLPIYLFVSTKTCKHFIGFRGRRNSNFKCEIHEIIYPSIYLSSFTNMRKPFILSLNDS